MEMQIAICDDEDKICLQLKDILGSISDEKSVEFIIQIFQCGEDLCKSLKDKDYDLIFLDIELPKINGIEVGKYIREKLNNEIVQIAYISAKTEYAMELFDYRPINFLQKPLDKEKVLKVIDKYMILREQDNYIFSYKKNREFFDIPMSEIMYFESSYRKVKVYMRNGEDEFYDSLDKVYKKLKAKNFLFIHKSIIVNYNFIRKMAYEEVTLFDGTVLPISQIRRKAIRKMYMEIRRKGI